MAEWQSGYAAACKAVDAGSIPTSASKSELACPGGEIGRRNGLKIRWTQVRAGSSPALGTTFGIDTSDFNVNLSFRNIVFFECETSWLKAVTE